MPLIKKLQISDRIDALLWLTFGILLLGIPLVGWVSGDAIAHSENFANGSWVLNPNHLLFEPIGAYWQAISKIIFDALSIWRSDPDRLTLLSVIAGSLSIALFRLFIPELAATRLVSNISTATVGLSSAFSRLWISGEHFMIMIPALIVMLFCSIRYLRTFSTSDLVLSAVAGAFATLSFISTSLLCAATAFSISILLFWKGESRRSITYFFRYFMLYLPLCVTTLLAVWIFSSSNISFIEWLTSYRGGSSAARDAQAYGIRGDGAIALVRACYGTFSSALNLEALVSIFRDDRSVTFSHLVQFFGAMALLMLGFLALIQITKIKDHLPVRMAVLLAGAWLASTLFFGTVWNNADDQFYFHLAPIFGLLVAVLGSQLTFQRSLQTFLLALVLTVNAFELYSAYLNFPRSAHIAALQEALKGSGLVVMPGGNQASILVWFTEDRIKNERLDLISLSNRAAPQQGYEELSQRIEETLKAGKRVDILEVFDTPSQTLPWKYLKAVGYKKEELMALFQRYPLEPESRFVKGYSVRSLSPLL